MHREHNIIDHGGVDPGFSVGGGANPPGARHQNTNLPDFPKKCMESWKFCSVGEAHTGGTPLDPSLPCHS